ncbi:hypothetical protein M0802_003193 [Mischocyttarus mexicanus]|nr:hypothetical protein M0802_003193 [Mischocyttarus mexicanus]
MENISNYSISTLINNIFFHLTGRKCENQLCIRTNSKKISTNGDLYILVNLALWKNHLMVKLNCNNDCQNILEHYAHTRDTELEQVDNDDTNEKVLQSLILASESWNYKIRKCTLEKERVCIFLDRPSTMKTIINSVIRKGSSFGRNPFTNEEISLVYLTDKNSDLTNRRLKLILEFSTRILNLQGYRISYDINDNSIVLSNKSNKKLNYDWSTHLCGVVKNSETNVKETTLTWKTYIHHKMKMIGKQNLEKNLHMEKTDIDSYFLNMAEATVIFELLSIKPIRPVNVNVDTSSNRSLTNTKGIHFIFYNIGRIKAILNKYNEGILDGKYPELPDIATIDFSVLDDEGEWELIYDYMVRYSEVIENSVRHKPTFQICPQTFCAFLSELCIKFSIYYSKIKILTEGYKHLHSKLIAKIYMLKALNIIFQNALTVLGIKYISLN